MGVGLTVVSGEFAHTEYFCEKRGRHMLCRFSLDDADDDQVLEMLSDENRTARIGYVTSLYVRGDIAGGWGQFTSWREQYNFPHVMCQRRVRYCINKKIDFRLYSYQFLE